MKKYGIFYGSATGSTEGVASDIAGALGAAKEDVVDVRNASPDMFGNYETLVLGTSTWGDGEVEEDWYDMLDAIDEMSLKGKKIALFGCGDETMSETFCNGVGELYSRLGNTGADFIAPFDTAGYEFNQSSALIEEGLAVGLLLDQVNHADLTPDRIKEWCELIKNS